jgi:osmotically-inducible protein OsmY
MFPVLVLGLAVSIPARAQDSPSASESMHQAGESVEQVGNDAALAAKQTYNGTATAVTDTKITTKVKVALLAEKLTRHETIHVDTVAGVVTLTGAVRSRNVAGRADQLVQQTEGVKRVNDQLTVLGPSASAQ